MEVLQDKPLGQRHYKRKHDSAAESDRRLDWSVRDNDILLQPRSPCSLNEVLGQRGLHIDLLPAAEPRSADHADAPPADSSARVGLMTCHRSAELQRLCKQVLVENALIKQRGQRTLFLAAGFVDLPAADSAARRPRAPLLFYPVILARRVSEAGTADAATNSQLAAVQPDDAPVPRQLTYELRLDSDAPELNTLLVDQCAALFNVELPEPATHESLNLYFNRVAQALGTCDDLHLSMEMALGSRSNRLSTGHADEEPYLPALPVGFDPVLVRTLLDGTPPNVSSLDDLELLLDLLDDGSLLPGTPVDFVLTDESSPDTVDHSGVRDRLHEFSTKLAQYKIGHIEFKRLPSLPRDLDRWSSSVRACLRTGLIADVLAAPDITGRQLVRLAGIIELLDKAPDRLADFAHPDLCRQATSALLQRARHQARLIEEEMKAAQVWFDLDKIPPRHRLLQLMDDLETAIGRDPELVDARYFGARRQFMEFNIDKPTQVDAEHLERLRALAKLLRFRELFINNPEYRRALGPGYRGMRTDWARLAQCAAYSRELAESMGSESLAGKALMNWDRFRQAFVSDLATLQRAADHLRKLLWALGTHWQVAIAGEVLEQARGTMVPLAALLDEFGDVADQAADSTAAPSAATPAELLALHGRQPGNLAENSRHAESCRVQLRQRLSDGELSAKNMFDTLEWLRAASASLREQAPGEPGERLVWLASRLADGSSTS